MKDRVTLTTLRKKKERGEKIVMLTCYDFPTARLLDQAGVDLLLVGDSLGDNVLGYSTTLPVTMDEIIHHTKAVRRGVERAMIVADMPFLSYQVSPERALLNAGRLMKETGVEAVKLEGGAAVAPTVAKIVGAGIPVMGHVGFTPQSVHQLGGYRLQGQTAEAAARLRTDLEALADAGCFAVVLELIPPELAADLSRESPVPTIGIGAGPGCDGQVQVLHDLIGLYPDRVFRHAKRYTEAGRAIQEAAKLYAEEVRAGTFMAD